jgi:hypothetical protein
MVQRFAAFLMTVALFAAACNNASQSDKPIAAADTAFQRGTFGYDLNFLKQHDTVVVLQSGDAKVIVSPKYQAKVFTSTVAGDTGLSFGWINYKAFGGNSDPHMNAYGGENRIWLGPEGGKFALSFPPGTKMGFATWKTPAPFDSEPWTVKTSSDRSVQLTKDMQLTNYAGTVLTLTVDRTVSILDRSTIDSLLCLAPDSAVKAVGYRTVNQLTNKGKQPWTEASGTACLWLLDMLNTSPASTIVIPYTIDTANPSARPVTTDYFGEIAPDRIRLDSGVIYFKADGNSRGKLGVHPAFAKPVTGSYDAIHHVLTITLFDVDPLARYLNQEWNNTKPPYSGDAVNSYNDGKLADGSQIGPFFELESVAPAAFLAPGQTQLHRHTVLHFRGPEEDLDAISRKMLGVSIEKIKQVFH